MKSFPAELGGAGLVRAIRGPFPHIPLIPTGGVTAETAAFLAAGAIAVGAGSRLTGSGDMAEVERRARAW